MNALRDGLTRGRRSVPAIAVVLLLGSASSGCHRARSTPAEDPSSHPVVVIGLDGFEWNIALPLMLEGRLPHLKALAEHGSYGTLRSMRPTASPVIWTTIATGVPPERHGITGFRVDGGELARSDHRRVKALWNVFGDYGRRVAFLGWWATWPVEPVNGVLVAQVNTTEPNVDSSRQGGFAKGGVYTGLDKQVHPPEMQEELLAAVPVVQKKLDRIVTEIFGRPWNPELGSIADRLWSATRWSVRADAIYREMALRLLEQPEPFDVFAIYFGGPDVIGHRFWRYMEPDRFADAPAPEVVAALGDFIPTYYEHMDAVVGELLTRVQGDPVVLVLSDHGMAASRTSLAFDEAAPDYALLSGNHVDPLPCFFVIAGPGVRRGGPLPTNTADLQEVGSVLDVFPTLSALVGVPLARDLPGRVIRELFESGAFGDTPQTLVDSYTPPGWYASRQNDEQPVRDEQERLEQLRSLGYID